VGNLQTIQAEPCIAAHPSKPDTLIVSAAEFVEGRFQAKAYASQDAGKTWNATEPDRSEGSIFSVNNWVSYGGDGTAYYSILGHPAGGENYIGVCRSADGGRSWKDPVKVPGQSYDQPRIVANTGKGAAMVYVAAKLDGIAVLRSSDAGASFEIASRVAPSNLGAQPRNPLILEDESLLIPFADFPSEPDQPVTASRIYVIRSVDGGASFDRPRYVADVPRAFPGGGVAFATDLSRGPFRGRIYAVWEDGDFGGKIVSRTPKFQREESGSHRELAISYSANHGRKWSAAKRMAAPDSGPMFMGCAAVAPDGTLGLLWIQHEKYEKNPRDYSVRFAASTDGGETFTPPQVVSSAISRPNRAELAKIDYLATRPRGGDYNGLAAASDSTFHAVWADARDGLFHIFHAPIRVVPR